VSSLWTPYGEEPVPPAGAGSPPSGGGSDDDLGDGPGGPGGGQGGGPGPEDLDPEQMREMLARLAATPVEAIVTQFAVELQEITVLHLGLAAERPESLASAAIALDAMAGLVDAVGDRLGPNTEPLRQAVAALRLGFVEVASELSEHATGEGPPAAE
jgi:hypothetical protein